MLVTKSTNCGYLKTLKRKYFGKSGLLEVESGCAAAIPSPRTPLPHYMSQRLVKPEEAR